VGANFLGAVLMVSLLLTVGLAIDAKTTRRRVAWMVCGVVQIIGLTLTFSRAPIGLAAVGILAVVLFARRPVLAVPLIGVGVLLTLLTPLGERFLNDATNRLALWYAAILLMIDNPWTGVGTGRMVATMRDWPERYIDTPLGRAGASAHNSVLLAGAELGVPGAIGALILHGSIVLLALFALFRARQQGRSAVELAGIIGILAFEAQAIVNNLFTVGVTSVLAAVLIGAFLLSPRGRSAPQPAVAAEPAGTG
jgi:O-antigen ligase